MILLTIEGKTNIYIYIYISMKEKRIRDAKQKKGVKENKINKMT